MVRATFKFFIQLLQHKWFVLVAGIRVGGIPLWRLIIHDFSKLSPTEFLSYARHFHLKGGRSEKSDEAFAYAWLHHENRGPHHWGYWIPRSGQYAGQPLEMPRTYVREMVADWMGASRTHTGSWDMTGWLDLNLPRIATKDKMALVTILRLWVELRRLGYTKQSSLLVKVYIGH